MWRRLLLAGRARVVRARNTSLNLSTIRSRTHEYLEAKQKQTHLHYRDIIY